MGPTSVDNGNDIIDNNDEWNSSSPSPSFIRELPESVKLVLASLFVALLLHAFFASRRLDNDQTNGDNGSSVRGRVGAVGSVGASACASPSTSPSIRPSISRDHGASDGAADAADDDSSVNSRSADKNSKKDGEVLGSSSSNESETPAASESENAVKKKKRTRNSVDNRNYDALICKREEETSSDGEGDRAEAGSKKSEVDSFKSKPSVVNDKKKLQQTVEGLIPSSSSQEPSEQPSPPPLIELKSKAKHPGLQGYYNWHATITSLYRIYAIPSHALDGDRKFHPAILPMHPSSERGQVPLHIYVTNATSHDIDVYWIDYKGNEVHKGRIPKRRGVWTQTTFIGHPWTFRTGEGEENVLLKYAPFRIAPSIAGAVTSRTDSGGNTEGVQRFALRDAPEGYVTRVGGLVPMCWVDDEILPEVPLTRHGSSNDSSSNNSFASSERNDAVQWSCQQIQREDVIGHRGNASAKRLLQYLKNVCLHPDDPKYRRLRLGNRIFRETIYDTGARGVLLALGFEELYWHMECGPGGGRMLGHDRIRDISDAMEVVNRALKIMEGNGGDGIMLAQPEGGDGFGRAGFGHAGGMNL